MSALPLDSRPVTVLPWATLPWGVAATGVPASQTSAHCVSDRNGHQMAQIPRTCKAPEAWQHDENLTVKITDPLVRCQAFGTTAARPAGWDDSGRDRARMLHSAG